MMIKKYRTRILLISICFISKQCGAHIVTHLILEMPVSMLITGRILEENLIYSNMNESNALNGKQKTLCIHILKVVAMNIDVSFLMAGKSKSIIHITIRCMHAGKESPVKNLTALISTKKVIKDIRSVHFLSISQETEGILLEEHIMHSINNTNI